MSLKEYGVSGLSRGELNNCINELEHELNGVINDAQRASISIQNAVQKQALRVDTLFAITQMLHDTAMVIMNKDESEFCLTEWEEELEAVGNNARRVNIDLQNSLQKQELSVDDLFTIAQMLHDTARVILNKNYIS